MSLPYVGEIRLVGFNFAPLGWAFCDGSLLSIAENEVLFNLIGTTYGGDGQNTFALPDLRGRVPVHQGTGQSTYVMGQAGGVENVALTTGQIPSHTHALAASSALATPAAFKAAMLGSSTTASYYGTGTPTTAMAAGALVPVGGSQQHENVAPSLALNFIISLFGVFPSPA
jgi:microcystin-dependent protein